MTEAEWLACEDPVPMLTVVKGKASERKLRLFACACCRHVWHLLTHPVSRKAVEVAEKYADGRATVNSLYDAYQAADDIWSLIGHAFDEDMEDDALARAITKAGVHRHAVEEAAGAAVSAAEHFEEKPSHEAHVYAAGAIGFVVGGDRGDGSDENANAGERAVQALILRDIFGNPFRPVVFDPAWLTSDVLALARGIYEERAVDRLPILADALEDAGCDRDDMLNHLRDATAPHVRGCWALDLVLGKE